MIRSTLRTALLALLCASATVPAAHAQGTLDLVTPLVDYKLYVADKLQQLVTDTQAFTAAVKAGEIDKAKALFGTTRLSYEAIEPIAELFSDLDASIDSRADDHEKAEQDPGFTGFHRIEYGLFAQNSTAELAPFADKLMADVTDLNQRIIDLTLPPEKVFGGAAALMEEVAATKISGEEDRYSHTDLYDFQGNLEGSRKIFDLAQPLIASSDKAFVDKVAGNFDTVQSTLAKYKTDNGFELYDKLTEADRNVLSAAVNTLAEDLSTLRGKLGLD